MLRQIALVSQSANVDASELSVVSAAVQKQVARDFGPIWNVEATVDAFPRLEDVPAGYYCVIVRDDVQLTKGAKGVHLDKDNQPFALVQFTDRETWSLFASHECLEMLVDPSLNTLVAGSSIKPDQGRVQYLLEVCDPCQDPAFSYRVNGIRVSDFYTPHYLDPVRASGVRYSFAGSLTAPREIREGGYLAWVVPETGEWWAGAVLDAQLLFLRVGPPNAALPLREFIDSEDRRAMQRRPIAPAENNGSLSRAAVQIASERRAILMNDSIHRLLEGTRGTDYRERDARPVDRHLATTAVRRTRTKRRQMKARE